MHQHDLELLVDDPGYRVQYCHTCEIVHVDVGPVTLRLRPGALDMLVGVLARSSARIQGRADDTPDAAIVDIRELLPN